MRYERVHPSGFEGVDSMRTKAQKTFGDLMNPKRLAVTESKTARDATPVRPFKKGGSVEHPHHHMGRERHTRERHKGVEHVERHMEHEMSRHKTVHKAEGGSYHRGGIGPVFGSSGEPSPKTGSDMGYSMKNFTPKHEGYGAVPTMKKGGRAHKRGGKC